jgi:hypothetical protein
VKTMDDELPTAFVSLKTLRRNESRKRKQKGGKGGRRGAGDGSKLVKPDTHW